MRSKEVEEAIDILKIHTQTYLDEFTTDFQDDFMGKVETVLAYIEDLEEKNRIQRCQLNDAFSNGFIHKDKIINKIKELEREKRILEDNKMKDKMVYTPYQIVNVEILRLKELLGEQYEK